VSWKTFEAQNKINLNHHLVLASSSVGFRAYNNAMKVNGKYQTLPWEFVALTTQYPLPAKVGTNNSPTSGGRSVGIVRLRTTATEFSFIRHCGGWRIEVQLEDYC
jgi:hypothetical protein